MGERDDDLVGAAAAGGRKGGARAVGRFLLQAKAHGEGGAEPRRAGPEQPRGMRKGMAAGGAGEEQGEEMEEEHLERTRIPGAVLLPARVGEGAHGGGQGGGDRVHVVLYLTRVIDARDFRRAWVFFPGPPGLDDETGKRDPCWPPAEGRRRLVGAFAQRGARSLRPRTRAFPMRVGHGPVAWSSCADCLLLRRRWKGETPDPEPCGLTAHLRVATLVGSSHQ